MVKARAKRFVYSDRIVDDCEVPAKFWWARGGAVFDQDWASGDFETWIDQKVCCRAYGVEFKRTDIEAMIPRRDQTFAFDRWGPGNYASAAVCLDELRRTLVS